MEKNVFNFKMTNQYDSVNNYLYTILCKLVYEDEQDIKTQINVWKENNPNLNCIVKTIEQPILKTAEKGVKGFWDKTSRFMVLYDNDFIILVFRGSSNYVDWIKNLRRIQVKFEEGEGEVHKGFYQTVKNMRDHVNETINAIRTNNQKIFVTGHSLGGAQALLASFMCDTIKEFEQITTFGQPRVGDKKFIKWVNARINNKQAEFSKYFRIVNKFDPVASIPYIDYFHCGNFYINCNKNKYYDIELKFKMVSEFVESEELYPEDAEFTKSMPIISNHYMELYIENAEKNYENNLFVNKMKKDNITKKGISLHIGVNSVDPNHYSGWSGELRACENDAQDMSGIAEAMSYSKITKLLTKEATRENVIEHVISAADELEEGDIFFISYSGHGGQLPDLNSDEDDGLDETWCLYNGQLVDDEINKLWLNFKKGVRVIVLSDSCHSGTVLKSVKNEVVTSYENLRFAPDEICFRTFMENKEVYTEILKQEKASREPECSIRLISGCMDNQFSRDGLFNGVFTGTLLRIWNNGKFSGDYLDFHKQILRKMKPDQTPNYMKAGAENKEFDKQKPFSI